MTENIRLAVIGGGASGLFAAVSAAEYARNNRIKAEITVYEANSRVGKKILATGNGRCNFTNSDISINNYHGERKFAEKVYEEFDNKAVVDFFNRAGLYSKSDFAGRIYPLSFQASSVLDALRYEVKRLKIEEKTDTKISVLKKHKNGYMLNETYYADRVIVACGGKAAPVHGSDGSGFRLLESFGIHPTSLVPALTPLIVENFTKGLKGIRAQGTITLRSSGKVLASDTGEIQYTDYGLSGIPSMQVSGAAARALDVNKTVIASVDSCPSMSGEQLKKELTALIKHNPSLPGEMLLSGLMPKRLGVTLLGGCSVNPAKEVGIIHGAVIDKIVGAVKDKKYKISSVKGFSDAQVTSGGIRASEIDPETMELKKAHGIYVCGEIIDVDGDCGGYNLQWAWSSGHKAGINSVREK